MCYTYGNGAWPCDNLNAPILSLGAFTTVLLCDIVLLVTRCHARNCPGIGAFFMQTAPQPTGQDAEQPRFTVIHHGVMVKMAVSPLEYMVLDTVYHLSAKNGYCYKGSTAMARDLNTTDRTIRRITNRLIERGLLDRSAAGLVCGQLWLDNAYVTTGQNVPIRTKRPDKMSDHADKMSDHADKMSVTYIRKENYSKSNSKKVSMVIDTATPSRGKPEINELFGYWRDTVGFEIASNVKRNRFACHNLHKRYGLDGVKKLVTLVHMAHADQYAGRAGRISDFYELQANLPALNVWIKGKASQPASTGIVSI